MKLLLIDCEYVIYKPTIMGWNEGDEVEIKEKRIDNVICVLIHAEPPDAENEGKVITKAVKQIKWLCGKLGNKRVLLHSFAHLSHDKADPETGRKIIKQISERLKSVDYQVFETPFGWFLDFETKWRGHSLGRIFKSI